MLGLDVAKVRDDLSAALSASNLTGGTRFASVEDDFRIRIELAQGKGSIRGRVEADLKADGGLDFILTTDQTFLAVTLSHLDALLAAFPALRAQ